MLDRLVESKNHNAENKKLNSLLGTIFMFTAAALTFAFIYSLFSFELNLSSGDLELTSLVAPTVIDEVKPEPPIVRQEQTTEKNTNNIATRRENIQQLTETPVKPPDTISVVPSKVLARPNAPFIVTNKDYTPTGTPTVRREPIDSVPTGIQIPVQTILENNDKDQPVVKKPVKTEEKKPKQTITGGVVNGKAKYLAQPVYSAAAKAVRAGGKVEVQVMIDETGRVISANAISGNPLLKDSAVDAARKSTFSPTLLSKEPVRVSGIIVYNFNPQ